MKYAIFTLIIIGLILLLYSCNRKVTFEIDNLPAERIIFGQGGGFTGAYVDFILLENGQVFKQNSLTKAIEELSTIKKKRAKELFGKVKIATATPVKEPGNMTYSLRYQTAEMEQSVTWGSASYEVADSIKTVYDELVTAVNPTSVTEKK
ncbi:MAG: hypothetical protein AB8G22_12280 [Saprospiraceae bacterium]